MIVSESDLGNIRHNNNTGKRRAPDDVEHGTDFFNPSESQNVADYMSQMLEKRSKKMKLTNTRFDKNDDEDRESGSSSSSESDEEAESDSDSEDNSPAEAGVIERLELKNFMCHSYFELEFGPQLNFIIGRNGSGKSAILTGIAVALGARASDTSRGSSTKNLIMDGKSTARVKVTFKNTGREAFRPDMFGSKIIVERKLQRQGSNGYFIRSEAGKNVSSKKNLLDEILHHFNITVNNPLAFLTQDKAREFLTSSTDQTKYNYFMEGSLINEIMENYKQISSNMIQVQDKLKQARAHLSLQSKKYESSVSLYNMFKKSDSLRKKLQLVHGKIYWYNVTVIEKKIAHYKKKLDQVKTNMQKAENRIKEVNDITFKRQGQNETMRKKQEEVSSESVKLKDDLNDAKVKYQKIKAGISDISAEIESSDKEIKNLKDEIRTGEQEILKEQQRLNDDNGGSKETIESKIKSLKEKIVRFENERNALRSKIVNFSADQNNDYSETERNIALSKSSLRTLQEKMKVLKETQKDRFLPWGRNVTGLLSAIKATKGWHHEPIGPIGAYVSIKNGYSDWGNLINSALGKILDSFLVYDEHDRNMLENIFKQFKIRKNIITRNFEKFEYNEGIARNNTTFLDILSVDNENILYTLIDSGGIEKSVITTDISKLGELVSQENVVNVFSLLNNRSGQRSTGDSKNFRIDPVYYRLNEPHKLSLNRSILDEINESQLSIEAEIERINILEKKKDSIFVAQQQEKQNLQDLFKSIQEKVRNATDEIFHLENSLEEENFMSKIDALKMKISDNQSQISQKLSIIGSLNDDLASERNKFIAVKAKIEKLKQKISDKDTEVDNLRQQLEDFDIEGAALVSEVQHLDATRDKSEEAIRVYEAKLNLGESRLESLIRDAEERCSRDQIVIEESDTDETITREYENLQKAVKEVEKSLGRSYEDVQNEVINNKLLKEEAEAKVIDLDKIYRSFSNDLNNRFRYMHTTIVKYINEASLSFERSLALRGFKGEIKFNFKDKLLKMLVQTKGDSKKRTVDSFSGGEKSFMQIALLLSIWKVMDSKIRGLDEFDVFMDSVNRSISIRLLLNELRQYPKSQSIFITPQDIASIGDLDRSDIRIHKMSDPRNRN